MSAAAHDQEHVIQIDKLDKKITDLSTALAHLGKGTTLAELGKIIRGNGWTTVAELMFTDAIVTSMQAHVATLAQLQTQLLSASKLVGKQ